MMDIKNSRIRSSYGPSRESPTWHLVSKRLKAALQFGNLILFGYFGSKTDSDTGNLSPNRSRNSV